MVTIFRRYPGASNLITEAAVQEAQLSEPQKPALIVLAPDATSLNQRRVHSFPDAESAAGFIQFWFPPEHRPTLIAFWDLRSEPLDAEAETVVLIRDRPSGELAYSFSFVDAASAHAFLSAELARGLDPKSTSMHLGVPVAVSTTPHGVKLSPDAPAMPAPVATREPVWAVVTLPVFAEANSTPTVSVAPARLPEDFVERVLRVLRIQRWQMNPAAFTGFHSPPGRF